MRPRKRFRSTRSVQYNPDGRVRLRGTRTRRGPMQQKHQSMALRARPRQQPPPRLHPMLRGLSGKTSAVKPKGCTLLREASLLHRGRAVALTPRLAAAPRRLPNWRARRVGAPKAEQLARRAARRRLL
mmetsp:Transcript_19139/g.56887  ORF Transcript_19139/g.56887 Transcript_19139/m.56887 type:complete len:128 (-) Transcript_19139:82-465(-)